MAGNTQYTPAELEALAVRLEAMAKPIGCINPGHWLGDEYVCSECQGTGEVMPLGSADLRAAAACVRANSVMLEALQSQKCRCSKAVRNNCPDCGDTLHRVVNGGPLNSDQFDAIKAGDWYCMSCKSDRAATGFKYWDDRDLEEITYQSCSRCDALAAVLGAEVPR